MHVVHFSDTYLPRRDGVVTSIRTLAAGLSAHGHRSTLFAPRYPEVPADESLRLVQLPSLRSGVANLRVAAWPRSRHVRSVAAERPDAIHVHTPGPVGLLGILAAQRLGLPLVQTYHTDLPAYIDAYRIPTRALRIGLSAYRRRLGSPRPLINQGDRAALLAEANRMLLAGTDTLVIPTRAVLGRAELPIDPARIAVLPTGVAARRAPAEDVTAFRVRHGLTGDAPTVLFVGRVNREKGIDLLVAAFARLLAAEPTARLVLVGAVYDRGWLDRLLADVPGAVICTGELPAGEVAAAYACADVFAFASRTDTQGLVLQEAALAGLPVVIVDEALHAHGALGGTAWCTEPTATAFGGALLRVLREPSLAARIVTATRERALEHTPDRYAAAMARIYTAAGAGWSVGLAA